MYEYKALFTKATRFGMNMFKQHEEKMPDTMQTPSTFFPPQLREFLDEFAKDMVRVGTRLEDTMAEGMKQQA